MPFATLEQKSKKSWLFSLHSDFIFTKDFILTWWATLLWFKHRDQHVQMQYLHTSLKYPSYWKRSIQIPIFLSILSTFGLMRPPLTTRRNAAIPPRRTSLTWAELWLWLHNARPDAPPLFDLLTSSLLTDPVKAPSLYFFFSRPGGQLGSGGAAVHAGLRYHAVWRGRPQEPHSPDQQRRVQGARPVLG